MVTHLLYLHGFRSSPASTKSKRMARWMSEHRPDVAWASPQLPPSPAEAMAGLMTLTANWPRESSAVIGSSLGGFYATVFAQRTGCRGVVINPAVDPARDLAAHIGRQTMYHDPTEAFYFKPEYVDELRTMAPPPALAHPERLMAIIATGDEVLDWHEMAARYAAGPRKIVQGSDHALTDFDDHLPDLVAHLGL